MVDICLKYLLCCSNKQKAPVPSRCPLTCKEQYCGYPVQENPEDHSQYSHTCMKIGHEFQKLYIHLEEQIVQVHLHLLAEGISDN